MKTFGKQTKYVAGMVLVTVMLSACSESMDDLDKYITSINARPADPIEPIPPVKSYTPYEYQGLDGRDPFMQSTSEGSDDERSDKGTGGCDRILSGPRNILNVMNLIPCQWWELSEKRSRIGLSCVTRKVLFTVCQLVTTSERTTDKLLI